MFVFMNKLEDLEKKYEELGKEIEKLKAESKIWKPKCGERYWYIDEESEVNYATWSDNEGDEMSFEIGNMYKTEKEATEVAEKIKIYTQLKRLAEELNTEPIDWGNIEQLYCTNKEFYNIALERIGEENLLKLFK